MKKILEQLKSSEFGTKNRAKRILLVEELEKDIHNKWSYAKRKRNGTAEGLIKCIECFDKKLK